MNKIKIITDLATISGHLKGLADGFMWYVTDDNKKAFENAANCLRKDSNTLIEISKWIVENEDR